MRSVLRLTLRELDLTYMIKDEVMQITTIEAAEATARDTSESYAQARADRENAEAELKQVEEKEERTKQEIERLESERRAKNDERAIFFLSMCG